MEPLDRAKNSGLTPDFHSPKPSIQSNGREIKEVWCYNLDSEMNAIMKAAAKYPVIGMDTEFPGICFYSKDKQIHSFEYGIIRENVNHLKLIQMGLTFCTADGKVAEDCPTWQFNFSFDPQTDICNAESIQLLEMAGINFKSHIKQGINHRRFGELLTMSGLVLSPSMSWITFHGIYDFAYLLRILLGYDLPETYNEFLDLLRIFIPHFYDIKAIMGDCHELSGGLNRVAQQMDVRRIGTAHQSGSDSRVTAETFFRIKNVYFADGLSGKYDGLLYNVPSIKP